MRKLNLKTNAKHITDQRFRNSNERIVGADGNINAGSVQEVMQRFAEIASMISSGEVFTDVSHGDVDERSNSQIIEEAFHDPAQWAELGSGLAASLQERMLREGFMRSIFYRAEVEEGAIPRIRVRTPNVHAIKSRGVSTHWPQFVRDRYITTDEFAITATPEVDILEIHQGSGDLLEDKYFEAQEGIFAAEDRTVVGMMRQATGIYNAPIYFSGPFNPAILQGMRQSVTDWILPAEKLILANDVLSDIMVGNEFSEWFEPITKYEIVQTGRLGHLLGMELITDGWREPAFQVLNRGESFVVSTPQMTGAYTDRGPVVSTPIEGANKGTNTRGWHLNEYVSIVLANAKAVSTSVRI